MSDYATDDPNYHVVIPPAIKGKITECLNASRDFTFIGIQTDAEKCDRIEDTFFTSRYNLERTIATYLERAAK